MAQQTNMTPPPDELRDYLYYDDGEIFRTDTKNRVGNLNTSGYFSFTYKGRTFLVHRLIYWLHTGDWPEFVDHKNGDHLDNRIENLREATKDENCRNVGVRANNTTGYAGVAKRGNKYNIQIRIEGKKYEIYGYHSLEAAALARDILVKLFYGDFGQYGITKNAALKVGGKEI
ncbi:HNH endonuclease [Salmonella enterica subsp. enterica]